MLFEAQYEMIGISTIYCVLFSQTYILRKNFTKTKHEIIISGLWRTRKLQDLTKFVQCDCYVDWLNVANII